jgi:hypothetical protein
MGALFSVIWPLITVAADAVKPVVPKSERECIAGGGNWTTLGLPYPGKQKICDVKQRMQASRAPHLGSVKVYALHRTLH